VDIVAKGEVAEASISAFIGKRDEHRRKTEGERPEEEMYAESVRRWNEHRQRQQWWEWLRYHELMIRAHNATAEALVRGHRLEVERYEALLGIDETTKRNGHQRGEAA
jgi:hypothetical protein